MKVFRGGICGEPVLVGECAVELPADVPTPPTIRTAVAQRTPTPLSAFAAPLWAVFHHVNEWKIEPIRFRDGPFYPSIMLRVGDDPRQLPGFVAAA